MTVLTSLTNSLRRHGEAILYRIAGLPITLAALTHSDSDDPRSVIRLAYAHYYWSPDTPSEWTDLLIALAVWPALLLMSAIWFTARNGPIIAKRSGRSSLRQFGEQIACYFCAGILPPWYYIFSLHDAETIRASRSFLNRCETKRGLYRVLARHSKPTSPLADKAAFADRCKAARLATVPVIGVARQAVYEGRTFPEANLFIKPVTGRGGRGAERWDHIGNRTYRHDEHGRLTADQLRNRLVRESIDIPGLVQPCLSNHPALAGFSNGALTTVRALTCLDERGKPELVAAVFRMAIGPNRTVDNIHAGGIATAIDLTTGRLSAATDLGMDAALGWPDLHPDTGARICGTIMPCWHDIRSLALAAHSAFDDRICIGWDIALTTTGPCLVEGNGALDVDLMQRPLCEGMATERFAELLACHVREAERRVAAVRTPSHVGVIGTPGCKRTTVT